MKKFKVTLRAYVDVVINAQDQQMAEKIADKLVAKDVTVSLGNGIAEVKALCYDGGTVCDVNEFEPDPNDRLDGSNFAK